MGGAAGEMENKAISASNLKLKLKLTEAELGNPLMYILKQPWKIHKIPMKVTRNKLGCASVKLLV